MYALYTQHICLEIFDDSATPKMIWVIELFLIAHLDQYLYENLRQNFTES